MSLKRSPDTFILFSSRKGEHSYLLSKRTAKDLNGKIDNSLGLNPTTPSRVFRCISPTSQKSSVSFRFLTKTPYKVRSMSLVFLRHRVSWGPHLQTKLFPEFPKVNVDIVLSFVCLGKNTTCKVMCRVRVHVTRRTGSRRDSRDTSRIPLFHHGNISINVEEGIRPLCESSRRSWVFI